MRPSALTAQVEEYRATRQKLGFALRVEGEELLRFARYAESIGHNGPLTIELAVRWATTAASKYPRYRARRLDAVRRFAKYRQLFDPKTEVPPGGLLGPSCRSRPSPHIYSGQEIEELLRAASRLGPAGGLRPRTYVTLFGLLACTGLRISEALRLTCTDVDLNAGVLTVAESKFHRSRLVPLHPSTTRALRAYADKRASHRWSGDSNAFFLTERGTSLKYRRVLMNFWALRQQLGWTETRGLKPRIHDLRHTFAVRRLLGWYEEGVEVGQRIVALSTYLGHVKVKDTYWYLTATPELLAATARRCELAAPPNIGRRP